MRTIQKTIPKQSSSNFNVTDQSSDTNVEWVGLKWDTFIGLQIMPVLHCSLVNTWEVMEIVVRTKGALNWHHDCEFE